MSDQNMVPLFVTVVTHDGFEVEINPQKVVCMRRVTVESGLPMTEVILEGNTAFMVKDTPSEITTQMVDKMKQLVKDFMTLGMELAQELDFD